MKYIKLRTHWRKINVYWSIKDLSGQIKNQRLEWKRCLNPGLKFNFSKGVKSQAVEILKVIKDTNKQIENMRV